MDKGGSILLPFILSMHIYRLGLFSHLYRNSPYCLSVYPGCYVGTAAPFREVGWHCTAAVSAGCSVHQLLGCECTGNRSYAPLGRQNSAYIGIYGHIQLYIKVFTCIYKFQKYIRIMLHLLAC